MDRVPGSPRNLEDELKYWKSKFLEETRKKDRLEARGYSMERELNSLRAEKQRLTNELEAEREEKRQISMQNSGLRMKVSNLQRTVADLRAENQTLMQRVNTTVPSPAPSSSSSCSSSNIWTSSSRYSTLGCGECSDCIAYARSKANR